ncbi:hypothetical protein [Abyssalbus ytuae]|uniref:Uncharacterized protein n=1 Tax=Abyssalbus ytuae TaxID=2926907 RepID=A0A9E7D3D0_9FLAO|nr:hypothetical protein [Abyssalbus ytuae]UOB17709.1 hypothetical protein MQE35_00075 [Abyssalbus ytuae]
MKSESIKNLLILILLGIIAYLFFKPQIKDEQEVEAKLTLQDVESKVLGAIPREKALELQDYYIETRAQILRDSFGYQDARSFTISLYKLERYLEYVKYVGEERDLPNMGLRFYLGAKSPVSENDTLKEGLSTMFIVPTTSPGEKQEGTFFSSSTTTYIQSNVDDMLILDDIGDDHPPMDL